MIRNNEIKIYNPQNKNKTQPVNETVLCMQCFHPEPHDGDEGQCTWSEHDLSCGCFCPEQGILIQVDHLAQLRVNYEQLQKEVTHLKVQAAMDSTENLRRYIDDRPHGLFKGHK